MTPVLPSTAPIELLRRMKAWLANLLEVPIDAAWWLWLWRLLVRPATPGAGMFSSLVRGIYRLLSALWWLVAAVIKVTGTLLYAGAWPIRVAMRGLDKLAPYVNVEVTGRWADLYLTPILAFRGAQWVALGIGAVAAAIVMTTPFNWFGQA